MSDRVHIQPLQIASQPHTITPKELLVFVIGERYRELWAWDEAIVEH